MRRCQHFCGCEGSPAGRDPDTGLLLCAGCLGLSILGTDCSRARKHFGHMPVRSGEARWIEPLPLRDGDRSTMPAVFEAFVSIRTGFEGLGWDFLPLAWSAELAGTVASAGLTAASNPHRPPKDPPPGPLPPPPARPVQPNPPRR